ncbi:MAG: DUF1343 domain-containing protein [Verrucomicrobiota bacterium]
MMNTNFRKWLLLFLSFLLPLSATPVVELGIDTLVKYNFKGLEGKRVGLITNQTGVNSRGVSTIDILRHSKQVNLVALYSPEHGLYGAELAGDQVSDTKDERTGLPVYSLHGATRKPTPAMLKGIDVLLYDLQDIGCRSYTYISTMGLAMEAAGEAGIEFYVLDRPNPLGGNRVEGMPLDPKFRSFVGQWSIPYVYGLTCGELANMIVKEKWIMKAPKLVIVPMGGWRREMTWQETGLVWVPTSPHIPMAETCYHYVITGLIGELSIVSTGVGYTQPFMLIGHPSFNAFEFADKFNAKGMKGVTFRPAFYKPFYGSLKGQMCQGVQMHFWDFNKANLMEISMNLMQEIRTRFGPTLYQNIPPDKISLYDKVCGGDALRNHFTRGGSAQEIMATWGPSLVAFREFRKKYLIYPIPVASSPEKPAQELKAPVVKKGGSLPAKPLKKENK